MIFTTRNTKYILSIVLLCISVVWASAQSKINISSTLPSTIEICGDSVLLKIDSRNITTSTVSSIYIEVELPSGVSYAKGKFSGSGITEKNVSNLQKPQFNLADLAITKSTELSMFIRANCDLATLVNSGKLASIKATVYYTGGNSTHTSSPLSVDQPSLQIKSVSNRFISADLQEVFVRKIILVNAGKGRLSNFNFLQFNDVGLRMLSISGGSISSSNDTTYHTFSSSDFKNVGNKDNYLDLNEEVTIIDTIRVLRCIYLSSDYHASWGCGGKKCSSTSSSANVTIKTKLPDIRITPKTSLIPCIDSSNSFDEGLIVTNAGTDVARQLNIEIFQTANTSFYFYVMSRILENSFEYRVGKNGTRKPITLSTTQATYNQGAYSCLGNNPVGYVYLQLPDLAPSDTIYLDWKVKSCCVNVCDAGYYVNRWNYKGNYSDQCDNTIPIIEGRGTWGYYQNVVFNTFGPTDVNDQDTAVFSYEMTRPYFIPPTARARYVFDFIKPAGLTHSLKSADFYFIDIYGRKWNPKKLSQLGDTVRAYFNGNVPITLNRSELKVRCIATCNPTSNAGVYNYNLALRYSPDTTCVGGCDFPLSCNTSSIKIHCGSNCAGGLQFSDFDLGRISFGQPDNDNDGVPDASGNLDFDNIKTERVMYGDTLLTVFRGKFYDLGSTTSWRYLFAQSEIPYGTNMSVAQVRIKIFRNKVLLYDCDGLGSTYTTSGSTRTFSFDAGIPALIGAKCPLYSGFTFTKRDSVELLVKYVVDNNTRSVTSIDIKNAFYTSSVSNPNASQRYQCDSFSGKFQLIGYYFTNYGANTFQTNSCKTINVTQNFYLSVGNCCSNYAGGNIFPFEYRNWAKLNEIILIPPKGYKTLHANFSQVRTAGTGGTAYQLIDTIKPFKYSGDSIFYSVKGFYEDAGGTIKLSDDGFYGVFNAVLEPSCEVDPGSSDVHYNFVFQERNYLGKGTVNFPSTTNGDNLTYDAPLVSMAVAQKFVFAKSDTVEWEARLTNLSNSSTANFLWMSSTQSSNVQIISVVDKTSGITYTADSGVFRLGNLLYSKSVDFVIKAIFNNCDRDSIEVLIGYDCQGYPSSDKALKCAFIREFFSFQPINTRLDANLSDSALVVDLCEDVWYNLNISNSGGANAYGLYVDLFLRSGMQLGDTAYLFSADIKDSIQITSYTTISGNTKRWVLSDADTTLKKYGLPGINGNNNVFLKFKISTNCDFVSSSFFLARPGGFLKCGKPVLSAFEVGNPVDIKGIKKPYFSSISLQMNEMDACNFNSSIELKLVNLGPDSTSAKDRIRLQLPAGMSIDTTVMTIFRNGPTGVTTNSSNNNYFAEWNIPANIPPGDSIHFATNILLDIPNLPCGVIEVLAQALVKQPALCVKNNTWCDIDVATSSFQIIDSIKKSIYSLDLVDAKAKTAGSLEEVTINYKIENSGSNKLNGTFLRVVVVHDKNGDGIASNTEPVMYADTVYNGINTGNSIFRKIVFNSDPIASCNFIIRLDSSSCACDIPYLIVPPISIENAGLDTTICSDVNTLIGEPSASGNTYKWDYHRGILQLDSSRSIFKLRNQSIKDSTFGLILTTDKGACASSDTVFVTVRPAIIMDMADVVPVCSGDRAFIGQNAKGGSGQISYSWTPSDSLDSPTSSKSWAQPKADLLYRVSMIDAKGCTQLDSTLVDVLDLPITSFSVKDTCADSLVQLFSNSISYNGKLNSFFWLISNGDRYSQENPVISIAQPGKYGVRLQVTDSMGCSSLSNDSMEIFPNPVAKVQFHEDCVDDTTKLVGLSSISKGTFAENWNINGSLFGTDVLIWKFTKWGWNSFSLTAVTPNGCADRITDSVLIHEKPVLSIVNDSACLGQIVNIKYTSQLQGNDTIEKVSWDLGDGAIFNTDSIKYTYSDTGNYQLKLIGTTNFGCIDSSISQVRIHALPISKISSVDICKDDTLIFRDAIQSPNVTNRYWDLGSGYISGDSIKKVYANLSGIKSASLIVESTAGCKDTSIAVAYVHDVEIPKYAFSGNCESDSIAFSAIINGPDSIALVKWKFHDNDSSVMGNVKKQYSGAGNYAVQLEYVMTSGCKKDSTFSMKIDPDPETTLGYLLPCDDENVVVFNTINSSTLIVSKNWEKDGVLAMATDTLKFKGIPNQLYNISVEIIDANGCSDTSIISLNPLESPIPSFTTDEVCQGLPTTFTNTSLLNGATISSFEFNLGDGNLKKDLNTFQHTYAKSGSYPAVLTLTNAKSCTYDSLMQVIVHPNPVAGFDVSPDLLDVLNSDIDVIDRSKGASIINYFISDGTNYFGPDFTHSFLDSGNYNILQRVENDFGCLDSASRMLTVNFRYAVWIPNAFTPNKDNINQVFRPYGDGVERFSMQIFNRWGEKVFETIDSNIAWDGNDALPGLYVYILTVTDYDEIPHYYKGLIQLIR